MKKGWIQPGDKVYTNYNGKLVEHRVIKREGEDGNWVLLSSRKLISIKGVCSWRWLMEMQLKWYRLKRVFMKGTL